GQCQRGMATAAPEATHTAYGVLGGPAGAECLGAASVERLPPSPWWRRSLQAFARHQQNILCGAAFQPHDQNRGCAASESSSPSLNGGTTTRSTLTGSASDGSALLGT